LDKSKSLATVRRKSLGKKFREGGLKNERKSLRRRLNSTEARARLRICEESWKGPDSQGEIVRGARLNEKPQKKRTSANGFRTKKRRGANYWLTNSRREAGNISTNGCINR